MPSDTTEVFAALHRACDAAVGARLFTISVIDRPAALSRRAYTSDADAYPVTGTKPLVIDGWGRQVIEELRTFVANTTAEFAPFFPDHAQINALGCQSAVNIPVIDAGAVVGTINLLDVEGHFSPDRVKALEAIIAGDHAALVAALRAVRL